MGAGRKSLEGFRRAGGDCPKPLPWLLNFSRRDSSRKFASCDLSELVTSSVEIARPKWQSESPVRTGTIDVRVDTPGPVRAQGDSAELREGILNMLVNAGDAMPKGGTIEAGTRAE